MFSPIRGLARDQERYIHFCLFLDKAFVKGSHITGIIVAPMEEDEVTPRAWEHAP